MTTDITPDLRNRLIERFTHAYVKDDGDVYRKRTVKRKEPTSGDVIETTVEQNLSKLFVAGHRETGDPDILVWEAEAKADGESANWADPVDEHTEKQARERIERKGLTPAWEDG